MRMTTKILAVTMFAITAAVAMPTWAAIFDLTTAGSSATDGVAIYQQAPNASGTGQFPAFVQVTGNDPIHDAYNTTANNVFDNGSSATFNHQILLSAVPIVIIDGIEYRAFALDINEKNGGGNGPDPGTAADRFLSLDEVQIFTSTVANQSVTTFSGGDPTILDLASATLVYDLDAGGVDDWVGLNYDLQTGSGVADMLLFVRNSAFGAAPDDSFVYLYSMFGTAGVNPTGIQSGNYGASDGFEEWALEIGEDIPITPVPEPASLAIWGLGLGIAGIMGRRRLRRV